MGDGELLPCRNCGAELVGRETESVRVLVDVTAEPVFAGRKGQQEVEAWVCPECGETTPL